MRKLSKAEVATLVAGAVIGLNNVHATEPTAMDTITVTATNTPIIQVQYNGYVPSTNSQNLLTANATQQGLSTAAQHAWACAVAYGGVPGATPGTPASHVGPNVQNFQPPWATYFSANYGWGNQTPPNPPYFVSMTAGNAPPSGQGWTKVDGFTSTPVSGNPYVGGYTMIFMPTGYVATANNTAEANLIDLVAHEWAHQWGAIDAGNSDYNAYTIGDAVRDAYKNDQGKKCGGL